MNTCEYAAAPAAASVDPDRWWAQFLEVIDRIAPRFTRHEPLRHAAALMAGMVSGLDRKNCWTIAEHRGNATPDGLQHLLARAKWDADAVRDDLRDYVIDPFGDPGAVLIIDETGDVKKGTATVGVQRQYSGTAGRIENSQVAVYLTYAAPRGHALIDRALYLPRCWTEDRDRCDEAGIPGNSRGFATKPTLAKQLISRAVEAKVPAGWVAGDEVYGADPKLRAALRGHGLGYVLAVAANRRVPTAAGPICVDQLPRQLPPWAWQKHCAGADSHGQRYYSWAWIALEPEDDTDTGSHHLLIRRNDTTGELAYLRCYTPRPATLHTLATVAAQRWRIEESFQAAKGLTQVARAVGSHRQSHIETISLCAIRQLFVHIDPSIETPGCAELQQWPHLTDLQLAATCATRNGEAMTSVDESLVDPRLPADTPTGLFVGGNWRDASDGATFPDLNPATGQSLTSVAAGNATDVDEAVRAARAQLSGEWATLSGAARGTILNKVADLIERDGDLLAKLEALDVGKPIGQPLLLDVPNAAGSFRHFAGWADKITGQTIPTAGYFGQPTHSYVIREPVGVIAAIIPWNTPLMIASWKLAPALAAGNTVVVKPPEDAPLSILHLASLLREAGLPDGVVNVVPGLGPIAGEALVTHLDVDKISFTGSPQVGRHIAKVAADTFKRTTLELGGKSPQIILEDADLESAINGTAMGLFFNQGEVCAAGTRVLVHRSIYADVVDGLATAATAQVLGDPLDPATTMGALVNAKQRDTVLSYIEAGKSDGARIAAGGEKGFGSGFFVLPTIFADATNDMRIAREEIFGPVGTVIPFDDADGAIRLANDNAYGLAAGIWTRNVSHAHALAAKVRAGAVWINGWGAIDPALPWGGVKASGIGRELGWSGILASTEEKVITVVL